MQNIIEENSFSNLIFSNIFCQNNIGEVIVILSVEMIALSLS